MKSKQWKSAGLICLVFIGGLSSCINGGQGSKGDALDAQPIVGSVEILNGDSVWVCNQSALKDTLVLPLSYFADELQIVKLDNRDEALVPVRNVIVSDNYILVWGKDQTPFKLFDKSGKFLGNVGAFGQGPGEYQLIYDAQIDEAGGRIYLLPWNARSLLAYDLKGTVCPESFHYPVWCRKVSSRQIQRFSFCLYSFCLLIICRMWHGLRSSVEKYKIRYVHAIWP